MERGKFVTDILENMIDDLAVKDHSLNERYFHHYFSHKLQNTFPIEFSGVSQSIHPEWPTYKQSTELDFGKYRLNKDTKKYELNENGTAGFIDFCLGDYEKPEIAIEFIQKYGWSSEDVIFDYMKLLDNKNPYTKVFSIVIICRENDVTKGLCFLNLSSKIDQCFNQAKERLDNKERFSNDRYYHFTIIEIDTHGNKRKWYRKKSMNKFEYKNLT
jgi:hypothetical protein